MSKKYKGKYRSESARLKNWDYGSDASYFITICTKERFHFFGEIEDNKMRLSHQGVIADLLWYEITNHAKNVELGEFIVMPNHVHGILIINGNGDYGRVHRDGSIDVCRDVACNVPTNVNIDTNNTKNEQMSLISPKPNTISTIVRSYKSAVTKHCNRLGFEFSWQSRFHDHIIRNDASFQRISEYIKNNPSKWVEDTFYKQKRHN